MKDFEGKTLSWKLADGAIELTLHREPCNEIGRQTLEELEQFAAALEKAQSQAHALTIHSTMKAGFSAGADLRELHSLLEQHPTEQVAAALEKLNAALPHYRRIHVFQVLEEAFTIENGLLTANGKLKRDAIAARFREEIEALYAAKQA